MSNPYEAMRAMSVRDICKGLGSQAVLFIALGLALWWLSGRELSAFVTVDLPQIGQGIALGFALIAVAAAIFHGFPNLSEKLVRLQAHNFAFLEKKLSMPVIVFFSICAGVGEEAFFRGGLQTLFGDYVPIWAAIGLSSAVFMMVHFAKPLIAAVIFVIGATFGVFYLWTGSLLTVMIGHAVYDIYAFWYLQREMHRLDAFPSPPEDPDTETAPPPQA